ncbi:hypothetical protein Ae331Ps2_6340c [Pseudonocardia sp. Ae331_Ps2]|nr:hypothetical protein Ae331Ps2_6340c [Pseudonocardia sp. Ae331_Ps2]
MPAATDTSDSVDSDSGGAGSDVDARGPLVCALGVRVMGAPADGCSGVGSVSAVVGCPAVPAWPGSVLVPSLRPPPTLVVARRWSRVSRSSESAPSAARRSRSRASRTVAPTSVASPLRSPSAAIAASRSVIIPIAARAASASVVTSVAGGAAAGAEVRGPTGSVLVGAAAGGSAVVAAGAGSRVGPGLTGGAVDRERCAGGAAGAAACGAAGGAVTVSRAWSTAPAAAPAAAAVAVLSTRAAAGGGSIRSAGPSPAAVRRTPTSLSCGSLSPCAVRPSIGVDRRSGPAPRAVAAAAA